MSDGTQLHCPTRSAWIELLENSDEFDVFMTVGFSVWIDRTRSVHCLNHLLLRLNRSFCGKRFRKNGLALTGIVVRETKRRSPLAPSGIHYHMLLKLPRPIGIDLVQAALSKHAERLRFPTGDQQRPMGRRVSGPEYVDARLITDAAGLLDYITKELRYQDQPSRGINLGFVDIDGVVGID